MEERELLNVIERYKNKIEQLEQTIEYQSEEIAMWRRYYKMLEVCVKDYLKSNSITKEQFKNLVMVAKIDNTKEGSYLK